MTDAYSLHKTDVIIVGAGGAGLMAALQAAQKNYRVACISKVFPTRSHTVAAQGGINAALGNLDEDHIDWHIYDTIRGSDWLADQDAVAYMCSKAPMILRYLEHLGVPFSRNHKGTLDQRIYGGQSSHFGQGPSPHRACFAHDRTGHAILQSLYQQCLKAKVQFFSDHLLLDILTTATQCHGILVLDIQTGLLRVLQAPNVILATGGYGQIYQTTTSSSICTGDAAAILARHHFPLQDMEFIQFHPTGIYGSGFLISEAARAEGAYLTNGLNQRFMEDYAPTYRDLAPRDVITRAIATELIEQRGCGSQKDHVLLHLEHLTTQQIDERLPEIKQLAKTYAHINIHTEPIPVVPSVHYTMGGIPTDMNGHVLGPTAKPVEGLYAVGEAACVSVHGANRLGCNSLLDILVFAHATIESLPNQSARATPIPPYLITNALSHFQQLRLQKGEIPPSMIRKELQHIMSSYGGIFRNESLLKAGLAGLEELHKLSEQLHIPDQSLLWNQSLLEAVEVKNMVLLGMITLSSALNRKESRGAHYRQDHPTRQDKKFLHHSLCHLETSGKMKHTKRAVNMSLYPPEARKY